jgi:acetyltransferase-like isoleucine patch superfamily enzyme
MAIGEEALRGLVNTIVASHCMPPGIRHRLLRWCGVTMGPAVVVQPGFSLVNANVTIGAGSVINMGCCFDGWAPISIGANCDIGMDVMLFTSSHRIDGHARRAGPRRSAPINVGDGCFIGPRATLLPGVSVAHGCIVAAGAVVVRDTLPDGLYGGVPAVRLEDLSPVPDDVRRLAANGHGPSSASF